MEEYTFERLWKELNEGYQTYYTYMGKRYLLSKLDKNCYSRELVDKTKRTTPKTANSNTKKAVKELFDFMENIEYKNTLKHKWKDNKLWEQ